MKKRIILFQLLTVLLFSMGVIKNSLPVSAAPIYLTPSQVSDRLISEGITVESYVEGDNAEGEWALGEVYDDSGDRALTLAQKYRFNRLTGTSVLPSLSDIKEFVFNGDGNYLKINNSKYSINFNNIPEGYHEYSIVLEKGTQIPILKWVNKGTTCSVHHEGYNVLDYPQGEDMGLINSSVWGRWAMYHGIEFHSIASVPMVAKGEITSPCWNTQTDNYNSNHNTWHAYCAICGELIGLNVYAPADAVSRLPVLEQGQEIILTAPCCGGMEQGAYVDHACKSISANRYFVKYNAGTDDENLYGFQKEDTFYYNNAEYYNGRKLTNKSTKIADCNYIRPGYIFKGWTLTENGEIVYPVEAIKNGINIQSLSMKLSSLKNNNSITLYAVWEPITVDLYIHANLSFDENGAINNVPVYSTTISYPSTYVIDESKINPPTGYTVSFSTTNTNSTLNPITSTTHLVGYKTDNENKGYFDALTKTFHTETEGGEFHLYAQYEQNGITLPACQKYGSLFAGWYEDAEFTKYAGTTNDIYYPTEDITLYPKFGMITLNIEDVYYKKTNSTNSYDNILKDTYGNTINLYDTPTNALAVNNAKGAINIQFKDFTRPYNLVYKLFWKQHSEENWELLSVTEDGEVESLDKSEKEFSSSTTMTYTVPLTGTYKLDAFGAQGQGYGEYSGGLGGEAYGTFILNKGDVLTIVTGGQDGYNGGGEASKYGNGGGYTSVTSKEHGLLLIAGGGGGASQGSNGKNGGETSSLREVDENDIPNRNGEDGEVGGGGGYVGGAAGLLSFHKHDSLCFKHTHTEECNANTHDHTSACYKSPTVNYNVSTLSTDSCGCVHQAADYKCTTCGYTKTMQLKLAYKCTQGHKDSATGPDSCSCPDILYCAIDSSIFYSCGLVEGYQCGLTEESAETGIRNIQKRNVIVDRNNEITNVSWEMDEVSLSSSNTTAGHCYPHWIRPSHSGFVTSGHVPHEQTTWKGAWVYGYKSTTSDIEVQGGILHLNFDWNWTRTARAKVYVTDTVTDEILYENYLNKIPYECRETSDGFWEFPNIPGNEQSINSMDHYIVLPQDTKVVNVAIKGYEFLGNTYTIYGAPNGINWFVNWNLIEEIYFEEYMPPQHNHTADCYLTLEDHINFEMSPDSSESNVKYTIQDEWSKAWVNNYAGAGAGLSRTTGGHSSDYKDIKSGVFNVNGKSSMKKALGITGYLASSGEPEYQTYRTFPIPTNGYNKALLTVEATYWGYQWQDRRDENATACYVECFAQNGELIGRVDLIEDLLVSEVPNSGSASIEKEICFNIPDGVTGIYYLYTIEAEGNTNPSYTRIAFRKHMLTSDIKEINCGYISNAGGALAGGGSNYISSLAMKDSTADLIGKQLGDGKFLITPINVGFPLGSNNGAEFLGLKAPDKEAPNLIEKISTNQKDEKSYLCWEVPLSNKSTYDFYVEFYNISGSLPYIFAKTGTVTQSIESAIAGYYYSYDNNKNVNLASIINANYSSTYTWEDNHYSSDTIHFTKEPEALLNKEMGYFHVAAIDIAGNIGETKTISLKVKDTDSDFYYDVIGVIFNTNHLQYQLFPETTVSNGSYTALGKTTNVTAPNKNKEDSYFKGYYCYADATIQGSGIGRQGDITKLNVGGAFPIPTATGCTFVGWNEKPDGSGTYYSADGTNIGDQSVIDKKLFLSDITTLDNTTVSLYAIWQEHPTEETNSFPYLTKSYNTPKLNNLTGGFTSNGLTFILQNFLEKQKSTTANTIWTNELSVESYAQFKGSGVYGMAQHLYTPAGKRLLTLNYYMGGSTNLENYTINEFFEENSISDKVWYETEDINTITESSTGVFSPEINSLYNASKHELSVDYNIQGTFLVSASAITRHYPSTIVGAPGYLKTDKIKIKIDKTKPNIDEYSVYQNRIEDCPVEEVTQRIRNGLTTKFTVNASDYHKEENGQFYDVTDTSGIQGVYVTVTDLSNSSITKTYKLPLITTKKSTKYDSNVIEGVYELNIDLYAEFPKSAILKYTIYVVDNAGNKTDAMDKLQTNTAGELIQQLPLNTVGPVYVADHMEGSGLLQNYTIKTVLYNDMDAKYNIAEGASHFKPGDEGHFEVWTVGYVNRIQMDFNTVGQDVKENIQNGIIDSKYNLGILEEGWTRILSQDIGTTINPNVFYTYDFTTGTSILATATSNQSLYNEKLAKDGVSYAKYYNINNWSNEGTKIKIPSNYQLTTTPNENGSVWEAHKYDAFALKGENSIKDTSTYIIWNAVAEEIHYRIFYD